MVYSSVPDCRSTSSGFRGSRGVGGTSWGRTITPWGGGVVQAPMGRLSLPPRRWARRHGVSLRRAWVRWGQEYAQRRAFVSGETLEAPTAWPRPDPQGRAERADGLPGTPRHLPLVLPSFHLVASTCPRREGPPAADAGESVGGGAASRGRIAPPGRAKAPLWGLRASPWGGGRVRGGLRVEGHRGALWGTRNLPPRGVFSPLSSP